MHVRRLPKKCQWAVLNEKNMLHQSWLSLKNQPDQMSHQNLLDCGCHISEDSTRTQFVVDGLMQPEDIYKKYSLGTFVTGKRVLFRDLRSQERNIARATCRTRAT